MLSIFRFSIECVGKNAQTLGRNNHYVNGLLRSLIEIWWTENRNFTQLNHHGKHIHIFIVLDCDIWVTASPVLWWLWFVQHNYQPMQILTASSKSFIKLYVFRCVCLVIDSSVFRVKEHNNLLHIHIEIFVLFLLYIFIVFISFFISTANLPNESNEYCWEKNAVKVKFTIHFFQLSEYKCKIASWI